MNVDLSSQDWVQSLSSKWSFSLFGVSYGSDLFFNGLYSDTSRGWMTAVDGPLVCILILYWLLSVLFSLLKIPLYKCARGCRARKCLLQVEFNKVYEGMEFDIPLRYAQHVSFTASVFLFSGFIPALVGLLPFYFFIHYWIDKHLSKTTSHMLISLIIGFSAQDVQSPAQV